MQRCAWLGPLVLVACTARPARVVHVLSDAPELIRLAELHRGELKWMSANARFVALYLYPDVDRESDSMFETPMDLVLLDTVDGARHPLQEVVATDPRGRYAVALAGPHLWLFDAETGTREDLAALGADLQGDRMRCAGGRQAAFDPWGAELLYLRTAPDRAVLRQLATGEEHELLAPPHKLWRAEPTGAPGWVRFHVVPRDTDGDGALTYPSVNVACDAWIDWNSCHDCLMIPPTFAGDREAIVLAHSDGTRVASGFGAEPLPLPERGGLWLAYGRDAFAVRDSHDLLLHADGSPIEPPAGCSWKLADDLPVALMRCADGLRLFRPETGRSQVIPGLAALTPGSARDPTGALWSMARVQVDGQTLSARLRLDDGQVDFGDHPIVAPEHTDALVQDRRGWTLHAPTTWDRPERSEPHAFDVTSGRTRRLPQWNGTRRPGQVERDGQRFALDLDGARAFPIPERPAVIAENGCALTGPDHHEPVPASWTLLCPPARSLRFDTR